MVAVYHGDDSEFSAMVYGLPNNNIIEYMENQFVNLSPQLYTDNSFLEKSKALFEKYSGSDSLIRAKAIMDMTGTSKKDPNMIVYLGREDILDIQTAQPIMQRFIMANPYTREEYLRGRIDGYSSSYTNEYDLDIGEDHYDYRRVKDGIVEYDDNGEFKVTYYLDPLKEEDRELTAREKFDILNTWERLESYLYSGDEDPTDIRGTKL